MIPHSPEGVPLKEPSWENVEQGEKSGPVVATIDDRWIKNYAFALDDYHPWYFTDSPSGGRIGHAALLTNTLLAIYVLGYNRAHVAELEAREEVELYGPVRLGQRVTLQGTFTDKFVKRGKGYTVLTAQARDESGKLLVRNIGADVFRIPNGLVPGQRSAVLEGPFLAAITPENAPVAERATRDIVAGTTIPTAAKRITFEQSTVFSFGPRHPYGRRVRTGRRSAGTNSAGSHVERHLV